MDLRNLILRGAFSATLAILGFLICRMRLPAKLTEMTSLRFDLLFLALFAVSRFFVFLITFFLLHQKPHADLPVYYMPEAQSVMHGLIPYRDFKSSYAPLNPYLDALLLHMHDSPLSILVFQIICDIVSIPFWIGFLRRFLSETTLRRSALLYLVQPIVFWGTYIDGKNHACISLLLAIALFTIAKKEIISGISYSLSFVLVKVLPLIFLPAMFSGARRRAKWLLSAAFFPVIVYGWFAIHKIDVTVPLRAEGSLVTPANVPFLFTFLSGFELPSRLVNIVFVLAVGLAVAIGVWAQLRSFSPARSL